MKNKKMKENYFPINHFTFKNVQVNAGEKTL